MAFYQSRDIRRKTNITIVDVPHEDAAEQDRPPAPAVGQGVLVALPEALGEVDPAAVERASLALNGEMTARDRTIRTFHIRLR